MPLNIKANIFLTYVKYLQFIYIIYFTHISYDHQKENNICLRRHKKGLTAWIASYTSYKIELMKLLTDNQTFIHQKEHGKLIHSNKWEEISFIYFSVPTKKKIYVNVLKKKRTSIIFFFCSVWYVISFITLQKVWSTDTRKKIRRL